MATMCQHGRYSINTEEFPEHVNRELLGKKTKSEQETYRIEGKK